MNSHKILPPIHVHPIVFFFITVAVLTGMLVDLVIIFFIVFVHEMGHYYFARKFNWKVKRIYLWIFGGVMETEDDARRSWKEEWIVTIAGPMQHLFLFFFFYLLAASGLVPDSTINIAMQYNTFILLGNLLPILPLDGGRMLQLVCDDLFPFQTAVSLAILLSCVSIVTVLFIAFFIGHLSLSLGLLFVFLFWENRLEWKRRHYKWWKFILYRKSDAKIYKKKSVLHVERERRLVDIFQQFYRNRYNVIRINDVPICLSEADCIHAFLSNKLHHLTIGDIADTKEEVNYV
ncbi:stage IV sporulation protein FB [Gracilibacillus oryzae]|uniref:Stage IV sporulation protein FB n=1 Tax=Gracilibacillus oryzae TaxID=1672701 RepID=A0A7C8GT33_9BACI|nr:site-2 protease family protein [Gracilibacillus oryzae]KAB8134733.1 stage IV sporulation protein FB [Gracilibacillus oryzae]